MKCETCGLPMFTGPGAYSGPQCKCAFGRGTALIPQKLPEIGFKIPKINSEPTRCVPLRQLTEDDVRRIVREELAKQGEKA